MDNVNIDGPIKGVRVNTIPIKSPLSLTDTIFLIANNIFRRGTFSEIVDLVNSRPHTERFLEATNEPSLDNWQDADAAIYGNFPRVELLLVDAATGNANPAQGMSPTYIIDRAVPDSPKVTRISWDLPEPSDCIILIN